MLAVISAEASAQLDDSLETAGNFAPTFGPISVTADSLGDGRVTLTRRPGEGDAGVDWLIRGQSDLPLDANHDHLTIFPHASVGGGYYVASLLFFKQDGTFIAEKVWIEDTNETTPRSLQSVEQIAAIWGVEGAHQYRLRIRINPVDKAGAGFVFDRIAAIHVDAAEAN